MNTSNHYPVTFIGYRPSPPSDYIGKGISNGPDVPDYEGVIFTDGRVAIRWLTAFRSVSVWDSYDDFLHVHGHADYETRIVFSDGSDNPVRT